ncbi:hypothetical protein D5H75_40450, partial [Bailinhaonella thermotolerans]
MAGPGMRVDRAGDTYVIAPQPEIVPCGQVADCVGATVRRGLAYVQSRAEVRLSAQAGQGLTLGPAGLAYDYPEPEPITCPEVADCVGATAGPSLTYDPVTRKLGPRVSAAAGNTLSIGTDGGLYRPASAGGGAGPWQTLTAGDLRGGWTLGATAPRWRRRVDGYIQWQGILAAPGAPTNGAAILQVPAGAMPDRAYALVVVLEPGSSWAHVRVTAAGAVELVWDEGVPISVNLAMLAYGG